jgi:uncharacterized protein (DUF362 family)
LLLNGGHIGDGIRPSERRKGYATEVGGKQIYYTLIIRRTLMFLTCEMQNDLAFTFDQFGLKNKIMSEKSILVKINLAHPAIPGHPRTDSFLLSELIKYIVANNGTCAIAESANGYLAANLQQAGMTDIINRYDVKVIDLDFEDTEEIIYNGEKHYIPKCFQAYGIRIALPVASKREGMVFSNNIKLFVGAVPRRMYQIDSKVVDWRPRVHLDLHKSVADIFGAIKSYSPFTVFINGGVAMDERNGEFSMNEVLVGDDGLELDLHILKKYFDYLEIPEYLQKIKKDNI